MLGWRRRRGLLSDIEWDSGKGAVLSSRGLRDVSVVEWGSVEGAALLNHGFRDGTRSAKGDTFCVGK